MMYDDESLVDFAAEGNLETVCTLLAKGANINIIHPYSGESALITVSARGRLDVLCELLKHENVNVNLKNIERQHCSHGGKRDGPFGHCVRIIEARNYKCEHSKLDGQHGTPTGERTRACRNCSPFVEAQRGTCSNT
jgi:hypothetical protein